MQPACSCQHRDWGCCREIPVICMKLLFPITFQNTPGLSILSAEIHRQMTSHHQRWDTDISFGRDPTGSKVPPGAAAEWVPAPGGTLHTACSANPACALPQQHARLLKIRAQSVCTHCCVYLHELHSSAVTHSQKHCGPHPQQQPECCTQPKVLLKNNRETAAVLHRS